MGKEFKHTLSPLTIGKVTFKNRLCVAPMGAGYGNRHGAHGEYRESAIDYMVERARGGFGMFIAGSIYPDTKVDPTDSYGNFMNHQLDFKKRALWLTERASFYDMKMIQQISFGVGRNVVGNYSCSPVEYFGHPDKIAPALTKEQIKWKEESFIQAAKLMKESGFVGVETHAMHWGYLLDQFAMTITNHREDEYGGALENRLRIAKELAEGVKQVCGDDFLLGMRIGLKSFIKDLHHRSFDGSEEGGRTIEESIQICKLLESYGYDMLDVDLGLYESFYYACPPLYMPNGITIPYAEKVKEAVKIPVLCGSRMNDPYVTDQAIADGKIDAAVLGRPSLADPYYAKKLEMGRPNKIRPCIGCLVGCMGKINSCQYMACAVNPILQKEAEYGPKRTLRPKKVAVIGGGVAGMEAARILKIRGHEVTIYEKSGQLGGLLIAAGAHDFKKEVRRLKDWYISEIEDLGIPVEYKELTASDILDLGVDTVVLALGSTPIMPKIDGIDHPKCMSGVEALTRPVDLGDKIVIVGGGLVGCETAIDYAQQGKKVTIVEATDHVLGNSNMIPLMVAQAVPDFLENNHVKQMTDYRITAINDEGAVVTPSTGGESVVIPADKVIMSIGMRSTKIDIGELMGHGFELFTIGDSLKVGNVYTSISSAYDVASRI